MAQKGAAAGAQSDGGSATWIVFCVARPQSMQRATSVLAACGRPAGAPPARRGGGGAQEKTEFAGDLIQTHAWKKGGNGCTVDLALT